MSGHVTQTKERHFVYTRHGEVRRGLCTRETDRSGVVYVRLTRRVPAWCMYTQCQQNRTMLAGGTETL